MRVMLVGDVCGRPGRQAFLKYTPRLREEKHLDIVIVNGENSAGGRGITQKSLLDLQRAGADVITGGNHIWDKREVLEFIDREPFLLRPANYPGNVPGHGFCLYPWRGKNIGVVNLLGRAMMPVDVDCPFQIADALLAEIKKNCDYIIVDFHAEATSEKMAMGWYLDGRVNVVVGTHTHIQTADERILPQGTAYITDLGMVASWNSVLGVKTEAVLKKFTTALPVRFDMADGGSVYSALIVEMDDSSGSVKSVERLLIKE